MEGIAIAAAGPRGLVAPVMVRAVALAASGRIQSDEGRPVASDLSCHSIRKYDHYYFQCTDVPIRYR